MTNFDQQMMARAISLAEQGHFTTRPNPKVGCVIVKDRQIIGEGYHKKAGTEHAEVHALNQAGADAQGATAYVTLEPCSHYGRTPPCAEGLIKAGIAKVVVAMTDPNPQVCGRGIYMLRQAGIEVVEGVLEQQAYELNPGFIKKMKTGLPYVRVKLACTLDGKTALKNGQSKWITGKLARNDVQKLRAEVGAVITGSGTVRADDPSLNVRQHVLNHKGYDTELSQIPNPIKVVLDSNAKLRPPLNVVTSSGTLMLCSGQKYPVASWPDNVMQQIIALDNGQISLVGLLMELARQGIHDVLVEAGATLAGRFFDAGLVDELVLYQAPKLIGAGGRDLMIIQDKINMDQVERLQLIEQTMLGDDLKQVFRLKGLI
ncbi:bifunctional diaminohydroxyphosphoribosylaminopyrimidine deaminase/5-amino-6-(5-phosphoribosylamino)uracil reductase RibD [Paraferrimonas sp. SM1919]|uniref:bifunctional diaminohydroxyphosphoribosylaminopyrimidine deaminase/5-amino-6-(5-phosphoribosylamino)uracil reductase RibD n=1 Tax=Paraferrimonas sp. SM1919 TaxID=2662263 RepID=UPI0013D5FA96|nr:bifunctional diaminohydroxyphosphoribosylaminopyrimidine deaminase/5-amino-6-(5-phosphoribosylamino)uracil reductase RibD [Paraferrimonas sp. SM1919]